MSVCALDATWCSLRLSFKRTVHAGRRGARKGRGLVVSPKDYSTKYRY